MKAILWEKYGPPEVLKMHDVMRPEPKENEVLVKIHATTVTAGDCELRQLKFSLVFRTMLRLYFGLFKPKKISLGQELSGEIIGIGSQVRKFKVGDQIMATTGLKFGAYAEYICLNVESACLVLKPQNISYNEAAGLPVGGMEALHFIKEGQLKTGQRLLINGAGGSIGTAAIQIAKYMGAHVTAVDTMEKHDILLEAGADLVIDYKTLDFTKQDESYDVIFDVVGKLNFIDAIKRVHETGYYIIANPKMSLIFKGMVTNRKTNKHVVTNGTVQKAKDLLVLKDLVEAGQLRVLIGGTYPLEDIVKAHEYVESGQKKGNLIVIVQGEEDHTEHKSNTGL